MARVYRPGQFRSRINMTPLIDVLLVLIVIFMIVTPIRKKGMRSQIPQKAPSVLQPQDADKQLILSARTGDVYYLNREPVEGARLPNRLAHVLAERGGRRLLFLDADDALPYGRVVELMDVCRNAGAEEIGVVLDPLLSRP